MKENYLFLAKGFEDTEAIATLDVLRRGGLEVKTVSITEANPVTSSGGVTVLADLIFSEFLRKPHDADGLFVFPGGMPGTQGLATCGKLMEVMKHHFAAGGMVACICAAPGLVASQLPGMEGRKFTCFPGFEMFMLEKGAVQVEDGVVTDGRLVTAKSAGWATEFGLEILRQLKGEETARQVRQVMRP